jgi:Tol biopolymer transport system component
MVVLAALLGGAALVGARLLAPAATLPVGALTYALDGDIYVAEWDGRNPRLISGGLSGGRSGCGPAGNWAPEWSRNGLYVTYREGMDQDTCPTLGDLAIADPLDGRVIAQIPSYGWAPAWSPDSLLALWTSFDMDEIGVYRIDGTLEVPPLTWPDGYYVNGDHDPRWSPGGESVLVPLSLSHEPGAPYEPWRDQAQTWELPLDGRPPQPVPLNDPRSHWAAAWSKDGTLVAYPSDTASTGWSLMVAAADGSKVRELVSTPNPDPEYHMWVTILWSPAGDRVAFPTGASPNELWVVDVATGAVTLLAVAGPGDTPQPIAFSPDGERILFSMEGSLWSIRTDASQKRRLLEGAIDGDWRPSPTGPSAATGIHATEAR